MAANTKNLRWGIEQRLEFIEFRLYWEGHINRADIIGFFGVSVPQASNDLSKYQEIAPKNLVYDRSLKRYAATPEFRPQFLVPDAMRYLAQLDSVAGDTWISQVPDFEPLTLPQRFIDPGILKAVLGAVRNGQSIDIRYQSLSAKRPRPIWRRISPHAFGFNGLRWHARAYCHLDNRFKDFLLSRILDTRAEAIVAASPEEDTAWNTRMVLALKPNPELSREQQKVVARDYGMRKGQLKLKIKLAMLNYFINWYGLELGASKRTPQNMQIVLADPDAVRTALAEIDDC